MRNSPIGSRSRPAARRASPSGVRRRSLASSYATGSSPPHCRSTPVPANRAVVSIGRYAVTLPTCPNWSQSLRYEFTNALSSNYGCANATNLGLMVASPADLASGRPFTGIEAQPAASAVQRYLPDRVKQPPAPTASPFAPSTGGGDSGGGATGTAGP